MTREIIMECDNCGCVSDMGTWLNLPFRAQIMVTGKFEHYHTCGETCFNQFAQWVEWAGKEINEPHTHKRHPLFHMDVGRGPDSQAVTLSQGIKGFKT